MTTPAGDEHLEVDVHVDEFDLSRPDDLKSQRDFVICKDAVRVEDDLLKRPERTGHNHGLREREQQLVHPALHG